MVSTDSTVVKHSPHHSMVEALSPTTAVGTRRESIKAVEAPFWHNIMVSTGNTVVKHSCHHSKVEALSLTSAVNTHIEKN
jgi:cobyrinic acid a,c-diamide synthase